MILVSRVVVVQKLTPGVTSLWFTRLFNTGEHNPDPFFCTSVACHELSTPVLSVIQKCQLKKPETEGKGV